MAFVRGWKGAYSVFMGKPERKRQLGRPKRRREDNIKFFFFR